METIQSNVTSNVPPTPEATDHSFEALVSFLSLARFYVSTASIFVALFGMGCVISIKDFSDKDTHLSKSVVIGLAFQSLIQPLIGYGLALLLDMGINQALAMIMLGISPVSPLCAILVYYGDGVVIVGMCLAMFSTALSVGLIPFWFSLYASSWTEEYYVMATPFNIVIVELLIIVPTLLGVLYKKWYGKAKGRVMAKICSNAFWIAAVVTPIINGITHPEYYGVDWRIWAGAVLLPPIGYVCGLIFALIASLPFNVCCAISLAVGMPNVIIANQLSETYLAENETTLRDIHGLITIFSLVMPVEGFVWAVMYRAIEEFFIKLTPKCCQGSDDDDDESDDNDKKRLVIETEKPELS